MTYNAKVIADSISPRGDRLTTMVVTYPRFILSEMNTHRVFSRNTASSRAIPVEKMIQAVEEDPFIPKEWPKNRSGMQSCEEIEEAYKDNAKRTWQWAHRQAIDKAQKLHSYGVHKQIVNRLLEPFAWTTQIISSTEWENFFRLRCHPDAQPEMQKISGLMREAYEASTPMDFSNFPMGNWHVPFSGEKEEMIWTFADEDTEIIKSISVARCARVSYLNHEGKHDLESDIKLYERLKSSGHWSPFEHVATPCNCSPIFVGGEKDNKESWYKVYCRKPSNFKGWHQLRWDIEHEVSNT